MVIEVGKLAGNAIVPYSQTTIRTKEVKLGITSASGPAITDTDLYGIAYMDSENNWWLAGQGLIELATPATDFQFTINGITVYNSSLSPTRVVVGLAGDSISSYTPMGVYSATSRFRPTAFTSASLVSVDFKVKLSSQPTDPFVGNDPSYSTFAAALEASTNASIYIEPASATKTGLVTPEAQSFAGVKTFDDAIQGNISGNAGTVTNGVYTSGNQTIAGVKTFDDAIQGSISGNAGTVTNGVYTSGNQPIAGIKTFSSTIQGSISGNAGTVTNGVYTTGNQPIAGIKTFSSTIQGSISGNAGTVTNGVYLSGNQNIAGIKNFTSHPQVAGKYIYTRTGFSSSTSNTYIAIVANSTVYSHWCGPTLSYTPYSGTSVVIAIYIAAFQLNNTGTDNDMSANVVLYGTQSDGDNTISTVSGGGSDQRIGIINGAVAGAQMYYTMTFAGKCPKASNGSYYIRPFFTSTSDASSGYVGQLYHNYSSACFVELY